MIRWLVVLGLAISGCSRSESVCIDMDADAKRAAAACTRLLEATDTSSPARAKWLAKRALHEQRLGLLDEAVADLGRAIELTPSDPEFYLERGAVHGGLEDFDSALADFDHAIALDPRPGIGYTNRATVLEKKGEYARSLSDYDRAVKLIPENWVAWDGRCWVRAIVGNDLHGALNDCNRALSLNPANPNSLNSRGLVKFKMDRFREAIDDYNASIAVAPDVASSYYMLGLARRAAGDGKQSEADIKRGLAMEPGVAERYAKYGVR